MLANVSIHHANLRDRADAISLALAVSSAFINAAVLSLLPLRSKNILNSSAL
jgi:hypothetical protein